MQIQSTLRTYLMSSEATRPLARYTLTCVASSKRECATMAAGMKPAMHKRRSPFKVCVKAHEVRDVDVQLKSE